MVDESVTSTSSVNLKIPDFWENDAVLWLANVEAQFVAHGITDNSKKYAYLISKLNKPSLMRCVIDIVAGPEAEQTYENLRARIVSRFGDDKDTLWNKMMSVELGDRKPSQLLSELRTYAALLGMNNDTVKLQFMRRLPPQMSQILTLVSSDLNTLADQADKMFVHNNNDYSKSVSQVNNQDDLKSQIDALTAAIRNLKIGSPSKKKPPQPDSSSGLCWYHATYGDRARRCRSPCLKKNPKN